LQLLVEFSLLHIATIIQALRLLVGLAIQQVDKNATFVVLLYHIIKYLKMNKKIKIIKLVIIVIITFLIIGGIFYILQNKSIGLEPPNLNGAEKNLSNKFLTNYGEYYFYRDEKGVYIRDCYFSCYEKRMDFVDAGSFTKLFSTVDKDSFSALSNYNYFKDKNNVYCFYKGDPKNKERNDYLFTIKNSDPESFQLFYNTGFTQDNNHIYFGCPAEIIANQSGINSFLLLEGDYYYQQHDEILYKKINNTLVSLSQYGRPSHFKNLGNGYITNGYKLFYNDKLVENSYFDVGWYDFDNIGEEYYMVRTNQGHGTVYYHGKLLENRDESFVVIDSDYSKDNAHVYYKNVIVENFEADTFKKIDNGACVYYLDKNNVYRGGEIVSQNPETFEFLGNCFTKSGDNYYYNDLPASYLYQNKLFYFTNDGEQNIVVYVLDKKTNEKKLWFILSGHDYGPYADIVNLPKIKATIYPNIISADDSNYFDISNNKTLSVISRGGYGPSVAIWINGVTNIDTLIDYASTCTDCDKDSCENLKPMLRDVVVNNVPQKIIDKDIELSCGHSDWGIGADVNLFVTGISSDLSRVYLILTVGEWNGETLITKKEYKLAYLVDDDKIIKVNSLPRIISIDKHY